MKVYFTGQTGKFFWGQKTYKKILWSITLFLALCCFVLFFAASLDNPGANAYKVATSHNEAAALINSFSTSSDREKAIALYNQTARTPLESSAEADWLIAEVAVPEIISAFESYKNDGIIRGFAFAAWFTLNIFTMAAIGSIVDRFCTPFADFDWRQPKNILLLILMFPLGLIPLAISYFRRCKRD